MTGEQRSADGWQENREKGKRGVRVEDGDFFFFGAGGEEDIFREILGVKHLERRRLRYHF